MPVPQAGKPMSPQCRGPIEDAGLWFHAVVVGAWAWPENRVEAGPRSETTATAAAAPPVALNSSRRVNSAMMLPLPLGVPLCVAVGVIEPSPGMACGIIRILPEQSGLSSPLCGWFLPAPGALPGACCAIAAAAPTARIVRWGLTGQKSVEVAVPAGDRAQPGRAERRVRRRSRRRVLAAPGNCKPDGIEMSEFRGECRNGCLRRNRLASGRLIQLGWCVVPIWAPAFLNGRYVNSAERQIRSGITLGLPWKGPRMAARAV